MRDSLSLKNISRRAKASTPPFWKKVRKVAIAVGAVSGAILAAPVALPAAIVAAAGYGAVVGAVGTALSSITTNERAEP